MSKVPVYDEENNIIARVEYNNNLDYWDGRNNTNGGVGYHKGLTKLKNGQYVLINGTQWQGDKDSARIISAKEALQLILHSGNEELLERKKFKDLKELSKNLEQEEEE